MISQFKKNVKLGTDSDWGLIFSSNQRISQASGVQNVWTGQSRLDQQ